MESQTTAAATVNNIAVYHWQVSVSLVLRRTDSTNFNPTSVHSSGRNPPSCARPRGITSANTTPATPRHNSHRKATFKIAQIKCLKKISRCAIMYCMPVELFPHAGLDLSNLCCGGPTSPSLPSPPFPFLPLPLLLSLHSPLPPFPPVLPFLSSYIPIPFSSPLPSSSFPLPFPPLPSPPFRSRPLIAARGSGERFSSPSGFGPGSGRQTVFGEFQAKNLASSGNDLRDLFRKWNIKLGGLGGRVVTYLTFMPDCRKIG